MFACCRNARAISLQFLRPRGPTQPRRGISALPKELLQAAGPVAKQLSKTSLWMYGNGRKKTKAKGDKSRVNVVGEKLCGERRTMCGSSLQARIADARPGLQMTSYPTSARRSSGTMAATSSTYTPAPASGAGSSTRPSSRDRTY